MLKGASFKKLGLIGMVLTKVQFISFRVLIEDPKPAPQDSIFMTTERSPRKAKARPEVVIVVVDGSLRRSPSRSIFLIRQEEISGQAVNKAIRTKGF